MKKIKQFAFALSGLFRICLYSQGVALGWGQKPFRLFTKINMIIIEGKKLIGSIGAKKTMKSKTASFPFIKSIKNDKAIIQKIKLIPSIPSKKMIKSKPAVFSFLKSIKNDKAIIQGIKLISNICSKKTMKSKTASFPFIKSIKNDKAIIQKIKLIPSIPSKKMIKSKPEVFSFLRSIKNNTTIIQGIKLNRKMSVNDHIKNNEPPKHSNQSLKGFRPQPRATPWEFPTFHLSPERAKAKFLLILLFLLANYNNAFTQLELESYIQQAAEKNENLKALHQDYLVALSRVNQVDVLPNPEIQLGVMVPKMLGHTGINRFNLGAMQSFPWFGTLKAKRGLALAQAEVKNKNVPIASLEIIFQLKKSWLMIYELEKKKKFLTTNLQLLDRLENVTLSNIEAGKSSAINVLKINLKKEKIKTELALLENQKIAPLATFNQLLQTDLRQVVEIKSILNFAEIPDNKNDLTLVESQSHPLLQKLNSQQQVANRSLKINDLNKKPTLGIGFDWTYVQKYANINFEANGRDMKIARARISLPIYTKQYRAKTQEEEQKIIAIDHQKKEIISQFSMIIEQAKAEHESAKIKIDLYEKQKRLTRSAIEILEGNFSTSGKGFEELLQMQMDLVDYDVMILEAIVESHLAVAKIEKIIF